MNMEQPPENSQENQEAIKKETILELLKQNGFGHTETMLMVTKWTEQSEAMIKTSRDAILLNVERTDLYIAAGDIDGAYQNLEETLDAADKERDSELQDQIIITLKAFRKQYPEIVERLATFPLLPQPEE